MAILKHLKQYQQLNKQTIWRILKISVAVALIGLVLPQVSIKSLAVLWERISFPWFLAGALAFYAIPIGPWPVMFKLSITQILMLVSIQVFGGWNVNAV